jgi:hypothetical protein
MPTALLNTHKSPPLSVANPNGSILLGEVAYNIALNIDGGYLSPTFHNTHTYTFISPFHCHKTSSFVEF